MASSLWLWWVARADCEPQKRWRRGDRVTAYLIFALAHQAEAISCILHNFSTNGHRVRVELLNHTGYSLHQTQQALWDPAAAFQARRMAGLLPMPPQWRLNNDSLQGAFL